MITWEKVKADPRFSELEPLDQLGAADRFFAESVKDTVDLGSDRYTNLHSEFRRRIMPDLKIGAGDVPNMSKAEQFWAGLKGGVEDLGLGAVQGANDALVAGKKSVGMDANSDVPFGTEAKGEELQREAVQMAARKQPLYDTTAGTIGQVAPALLLPGATIPKAIVAGAAYGGLQPVTEEGQRLSNAAGSAAGFGVGSALGGLASKGISRAISPVRGSKPATEAQKVLSKIANEAEEEGFIVTAGQRTGSKRIQTAESVIERTPLIGAKVSAIGEHNAIRANQLLSEKFGAKSDAITDDVLAKAREEIGVQFKTLITDKTPIKYDKRFLVEGRQLKKEVELLDEELRNPVLVKFVDVLYEKPRAAMTKDAAQRASKGLDASSPATSAALSGAELKALRSDLTDQSRTLFKAGKENAARQLNNVIDGLDDMAERSLGKKKAGAYKEARKHWQALRIAEDSIDDLGNVALPKFRQAIKRHRPRRSYKLDPFVQLRREMDVVTNKTPDSGSAQRLQIAGLITGSLPAATGIAGGGLPGLAAGYGGLLAARGLTTGRPWFGKTRYLENAAAQRSGVQDALSVLRPAGSVAGGALLPEEILPLLPVLKGK